MLTLFLYVSQSSFNVPTKSFFFYLSPLSFTNASLMETKFNFAQLSQKENCFVHFFVMNVEKFVIKNISLKAWQFANFRVLLERKFFIISFYVQQIEILNVTSTKLLLVIKKDSRQIDGKIFLILFFFVNYSQTPFNKVRNRLSCSMEKKFNIKVFFKDHFYLFKLFFQSEAMKCDVNFKRNQKGTIFISRKDKKKVWKRAEIHQIIPFDVFAKLWLTVPFDPFWNIPPKIFLLFDFKVESKKI